MIDGRKEEKTILLLFFLPFSLSTFQSSGLSAEVRAAQSSTGSRKNGHGASALPPRRGIVLPMLQKK